jgi:hypothetical protein
MRYISRPILPIAPPRADSRRSARPVIVLRALILLLIVLLLIFVCLMNITGGYHVGGPVLGSVLLIGLGAAHYAR